MKPIYLDTLHLSRLARHPNDPACAAILEILKTGDFRIAFNFLLLQELSDPNFASRQLVGLLLDSVPIAWANLPVVVWDMEIANVIEHIGTEKAQLTVFHDSFEGATGAPPEARIPVSQMIEVFAQNPEIRSQLFEAAEFGAVSDAATKKRAAIIQDPDVAILARINDLLRESGRLAVMPPAKEIYATAGMLSGFPSYEITHKLARLRLNDAGFKTERNDVIDEWHATYAPYCAAIALDKRTTARLKTTKVKAANIAASSIEDVLPIVARSA